MGVAKGCSYFCECGLWVWSLHLMTISKVGAYALQIHVTSIKTEEILSFQNNYVPTDQSQVPQINTPASHHKNTLTFNLLQQVMEKNIG
jgi:F0F1-type ATP synthase beta subunit